MGQKEEAAERVEKTRPFIPQDANMAWLDYALSFWSGQIADSFPNAERAVEMSPEDRVYRRALAESLWSTGQFDKAAQSGSWPVQVRALGQLGRVEEASLLAEKWAALGNIEPYFRLLNATGQSEVLVDYVDERWPDLDAFEHDFPANGYIGYPTMIDIALAYRRVGQQEKFNDAMERVRMAHDSLVAQGLSNPVHFTLEAAYHAMAGDREQALKFLASAVDEGFVFTPRITDEQPYFMDLEGDPEYEAIQARMLDHLNRERAQLGLEPVTT